MADVFRRDGAEDDLGTLEVGKLADIVLLDANPGLVDPFPRTL